jgi:predicted dehydrogenase
MIRVGIVGYGYWGPNLVRNFADADRARVAGITDLRPERLAVAEHRHPQARLTTDYRELINDPEIDAIVVATPVSSHFRIATEALRAGKHVLVEKPMTATYEEALRLEAEADRAKRLLMVDHTFVYTSAVQKLRSLIQNGDIGDVFYYDSVRINLGLFQHDVDVLWDLAVHDLSILGHLLPYEPQAVSATGMSHLAGEAANIAYLTLFFGNNVIAHIHVNWLAPVKIRRTLIGGSRKMIVYDDLEASEKIKVYDKGVSLVTEAEQLYQMRINYRAGDMWAPQLDNTEALRLEVREFIGSIEANRQPLTDGAAGRRVVRILEAATASLAKRGQLIELQQGARA